MPDETVIDGEVVALDEEGKPSFNTLQNYGSSGAPLHFFMFDLMVLKGKDVMGETLERGAGLLETKVLPKLAEPIRYSPVLEASLTDLIQSVKAQGLKGWWRSAGTANMSRASARAHGRRCASTQGQELVIGGYTPSAKNFDALVIGYYEDGKLMYAARTRNGFTPASRAELFKKLKPLEIEECPFANLPEKKAGRWGAGLTAAKMADCRWLKPVLVGQFEFVEWTE